MPQVGMGASSGGPQAFQGTGMGQAMVGRAGPHTAIPFEPLNHLLGPSFFICWVGWTDLSIIKNKVTVAVSKQDGELPY